ncbi:hypothetical protein Tco_0729841 [Tanacetum coccineum]|uniref:Uncharacterized protein n=1 Tax=Tanacetum coccineum TaxID=301880 RepID=A0ABQ4YSH9_9ASTR
MLHMESVPTHSNDPLLSGEDRMKLNKLMELYTTLSQRVLDVENPKTSQAVEITKSNERVKKIERRNKSRTLGLKRLRKVGRTSRIDSSKDEGVLDEQEVEVEKTLIEIKAAKPKAVTTAATTTTTAVTRPKARGVVVQDLKLQAEQEEEERLARQKEKDANIAEWDNVQAMIDTDYELAARLQAQEQEELTIEERYGYRVGKRELQEGRYDENVEAEVDDEAEMKKHMEIVPDDEVAIDAIPLATKPPIIVDWKIIKEGKMGYFQIIRADGSSRSMENSTRIQSDSLEAIFFKWSTFCEISESAYLYAGREKVPTYTCNNHRNAQQEASS